MKIHRVIEVAARELVKVSALVATAVPRVCHEALHRGPRGQNGPPSCITHRGQDKEATDVSFNR